LDNNLFTLCDKISTHELFFSKEFNCINKAAESIQKLQMVFGKTSAFFAKGPAAVLALQITKRDEKLLNEDT
jgi:hypothetical protein